MINYVYLCSLIFLFFLHTSDVCVMHVPAYLESLWAQYDTDKLSVDEL